MVSFNRVRYRVMQFYQAVRAYLRPLDEQYAQQYLSPALLTLFRRMSRVEQQHGLELCRKLAAQGHQNPELLSAALLHDVGKVVAPPRLWERVLVVLGEHYCPARASRWAEGPARGIRRGFVSRHRHPDWGAQLAAEAGAAPRTVALIQRHHSPPGEDQELSALQKVDSYR